MPLSLLFYIFMNVLWIILKNIDTNAPMYIEVVVFVQYLDMCSCLYIDIYKYYYKGIIVFNLTDNTLTITM